MSGKSYLPVLGDRGCPARHRLILPLRHPAGGLPSLPPVAPAFPLLFAPIPPTPFPAGRGRFLVFLCKGLRPLHPRGWMGRGTGSTCVSATRRGLALFVACRPSLSLPFCPLSPQPPSPAGKGEIFGFLMQGAPPLASPGLNLWFAAKPTETLSYKRCRQPRRGGAGGDGTIRRTRRRRLRWSSPPGQG